LGCLHLPPSFTQYKNLAPCFDAGYLAISKQQKVRILMFKREGPSPYRSKSNLDNKNDIADDVSMTIVKTFGI